MNDKQFTEERGFATGEHVVLRPVREEDLPALAQLLAANPTDDKPVPWTLQRLKQKFEDKDEPGLWGKDDRYYVIVRRHGGVLGFLRERLEGSPRVCSNLLHLDEQLKDRDSLGLDTIQAYMTFKQRWHDPRQITFDLLECEQAPANWLKRCGFIHEITFPRWAFYQGQPQGLSVYGWLSDEVLENRADDGPVAGEEV